MTAGHSIFIIVLTVANIAGCLWLLWWTRRSPGRAGATTDQPPATSGTKTCGTQQSAAALVAVAVHHHRGVRRGLPRAVSGTGHLHRHAQLDLARRTRDASRASTRERIERTLAPFSARGAAELAARPGGARHRPQPVPQQLRDLPWLGWRRRARLSQSRRQRLAVGRRRRHRGRNHLGWPHRRHAAVGRSARRAGRRGHAELRGRASAVASSRPATRAPVRRNSPSCAPPATAPTRAATACSARPISPTASGCTVARWPRCATASRRDASAPCRRMGRASARPRVKLLAAYVLSLGRQPQQAVASAGNADDTRRPLKPRTDARPRHGRDRLELRFSRRRSPRCCVSRSSIRWRSRKAKLPAWWTTRRAVYALGFLPVLADRPRGRGDCAGSSRVPDRRGR